MILSLKQIKKSFYTNSKQERLCILDNLHLAVNDGETIAIIGKSGSGKSTLLSLIAGLDQVDSGEIKISNQSLVLKKKTEIAKIRAEKIGIIFQQFHLMPHLNVIENIQLPLQLKGVKNSKQIAEEILEKVEMNDRSHHFPSQLSGGEKQRVAIARALITKPDLIIADEPTGNLDDDTSELISQLIFDLCDKEKKTLLLVTHDRILANRCQKVYQLEKGKLIPAN